MVDVIYRIELINYGRLRSESKLKCQEKSRTFRKDKRQELVKQKQSARNVISMETGNGNDNSAQ